MISFMKRIHVIPTGDHRILLSIHSPNQLLVASQVVLAPWLLVKAYLAHRPELKREQMAGNECAHCFAWKGDVDGDVCKGRV